MASVSLGGGGKVRPRGEWRRGSGVQRRLRGSRSSVQGAGRRAALPDGASRGRCLTGPAPHGPAGGATSRGGQGALSRAISRARQGVLPHGPAGGATSRARQGALPHGPGGRRPRLLRQLPFQLLEALLGGPFGPELPQATREVLVQQALQGQGDAGAAEAEAPQSPPNPGPGPTSSMKAATTLKATKPSSSSLNGVLVMLFSVSGPCRGPGARTRPTRTEPKSTRATRKGTGGGEPVR